MDYTFNPHSRRIYHYSITIFPYYEHSILHRQTNAVGCTYNRYGFLQLFLSFSETTVQYQSYLAVLEKKQAAAGRTDAGLERQGGRVITY